RRALLNHLATLDDAASLQPVQMTSATLPLGRVAWITSSHERGHRQEIARALGRGHAGGEVAWLNVSTSGVPKLPLYRAVLGELGLAGDGHRHPGHGGPTAALCIFSLEVIQRLQG